METDKSNPGNIDPGPSPNLINNTVEAETGERNPDPNPPENLSQASPPPVEATSGAQGLKDPYLNAAKANIPPPTFNGVTSAYLSPRRTGARPKHPGLSNIVNSPRARSLSLKRNNEGETGSSPPGKNPRNDSPTPLLGTANVDNVGKSDYSDYDYSEDRDVDWGDDENTFYDRTQRHYNYDRQDRQHKDRMDTDNRTNKNRNSNTNNHRHPQGPRNKNNNKNKELNTPEAKICFDLFQTNIERIQRLSKTDATIKDILDIVTIQNDTLNSLANLCMTLDKRVGPVDIGTQKNLTNAVNTARIKEFQTARTNGLKESAKEIKLPFVKIPLSNGKIDRKVVLESVQNHLGDGTKALVTPDVEIIPLRNAPQDGGESVPVLVRFKNTESCSNFETHCRRENIRVVPNYKQDTYRMVETIRKKVVSLNPGMYAMVRPSRNFQAFNVKIKEPKSTKWTLFTTLDIPLSPSEMNICRINDNPGFNSKIPNFNI